MGSTGGTIDPSQSQKSLATVLAIGTANPSQIVYQTDFPDFYFRVTGSEHETELKEKLRRMCDRSMIRKRHIYLTEGLLKENPSMINSMTPSLNARLDILVSEVPKLAKEAATKAINEWGQPKSDVTHLIFCTTSGIDAPGADFQLIKLLGLSPTVRRVMLYQQGCIGGATVLRVAKDLAENNNDARILVVCSELNSVNAFREPTDADLESLLGMGIFGDGAAALIIGANPNPSLEQPLFQLVSTASTLIPNSGDMVAAHLREEGLVISLSKDVAWTISENIENCLLQVFNQVGINDWNSIFWVTHPGGPAILDKIQAKLNLRKEKLFVTRKVLDDFGNMSSPTLLFILHEMRKTSLEEGKNTTGEGFDWGVLLGFGPGMTVETIVLRSCSL